MTATKKHLTLDILNFYYAEVHNLQVYLHKIIKEESYRQAYDDAQSDFFLNTRDSPHYRELLNSSYVCLSKETTTESPQFSAIEQYARMKDVSAQILTIQKEQAYDLLWRLFRRPRNAYSRPQSPSHTIP